MQLTPYIIFNGNCEEALNFYAKAFGGEIKNLSRYGDAPAEGMTVDKNKVIHARFEANGFELMASDDGREGAETEKAGMIQLSVNLEDVEEEERIFTFLSQGAQVTMPLQDTFWGARFGMLTDKFGVKWMLNCEKKKN